MPIQKSLNRAKPSKHGSDPNKQLASVNFPKELIEFLDRMGEETGMNRSALVCFIVREFMESGKKIKLVVD